MKDMGPMIIRMVDGPEGPLLDVDGNPGMQIRELFPAISCTVFDNYIYSFNSVFILDTPNYVL